MFVTPDMAMDAQTAVQYLKYANDVIRLKIAKNALHELRRKTAALEYVQTLIHLHACEVY